MRILISNDDGYLSPGIETLAAAVGEIADVTVVAPDRDRSGASHSLTLKRPLRVQQASNGFMFVDGTPTDCVHLAITGLMREEPDMIISGINRGGNLGDDVLYSGTVAAAMEGRWLGFPAMAVSLVGPKPEHYETAAAVVVAMIKAMKHLPPETILNVNVPNVPLAEVAGLRATRLGNRHKSEAAVRDTDPSGETIYWVGPPGDEQDAGEGTDFDAVRHKAVSVTPLTTDLSKHMEIDQTGNWLRGLTI
ncbi:MAG TPA: 5'/3'-nucleotidase SurE [Arenicellales bacterium]|nr:5'/3'-nucleotidase SurE [Arenicellales bacterium]